MNDLPEQTYRVFKRRAWKRSGKQWAPFHTKGQTIRTKLTLEEARKLCATGPANKALKSGAEYRGLIFFEFTAEGVR